MIPGFSEILSKLNPKIFRKTQPVLQNVEKGRKNLVTPELLKTFTEINKALDRSST